MTMHGIFKGALLAAGLGLAAQALAQVTFYEREDFQGRSFTTQGQVANLSREGFDDRASSAMVERDRWEVCEDTRFGGRCVILRPGRYPSLVAMGLNDRVSSVRIIGRDARVDDNRYAPAPTPGQVIFYQEQDYGGRSFTTGNEVENLRNTGFDDRASSVVVLGEIWEVCDNPGFGGRCMVLRPGRYPSLSAMGMNDRISSVRPIGWEARPDEQRYAPPAAAVYDNRRRGEERLYDVNLTSVRAVAGTPQQRCWVEQEQVAPQRSRASVPGAIAGALIGGILGHQVGNGIATAGGAVAGGVIGANVGRSKGEAQTRDIRKCENVSGPVSPDYWDVSYSFRGQEHRIQMTTRPGSTITVNEQGEPRS